MKGIEFKPLHINTIISEIKKKIITGITILEKICTKGMLFSNLLFFIVFNFIQHHKLQQMNLVFLLRLLEILNKLYHNTLVC